MVEKLNIKRLGIALVAGSPLLFLFQVILLFVPNGVNLFGSGMMSEQALLTNYFVPSYVFVGLLSLPGMLLLTYSYAINKKKTV